MSAPTIQQRVARELALQLGLMEAEVTPDKRLVEDLGADSLDQVEVAMAIEDEFAVDVPDHLVPEWKTVADIIRFVEQNQEVTS